METNLSEAESQLTDLCEQRESLQADLAAAVEAADAPNMIALQDKIDRVAVYVYAQRAKILRLQKSQDAFERSRRTAWASGETSKNIRAIPSSLAA